jgi:hypothetical protein
MILEPKEGDNSKFDPGKTRQAHLSGTQQASLFG